MLMWSGRAGMPCSNGEKSVLSTCSVSGKKRQCSEFSSTLSTLICAAHFHHLRHRLEEESSVLCTYLTSWSTQISAQKLARPSSLPRSKMSGPELAKTSAMCTMGVNWLADATRR